MRCQPAPALCAAADAGGGRVVVGFSSDSNAAEMLIVIPFYAGIIG